MIVTAIGVADPSEDTDAVIVNANEMDVEVDELLEMEEDRVELTEEVVDRVLSGVPEPEIVFIDERDACADCESSELNVAVRLGV